VEEEEEEEREEEKEEKEDAGGGKGGKEENGFYQTGHPRLKCRSLALYVVAWRGMVPVGTKGRRGCTINLSHR